MEQYHYEAKYKVENLKFQKKLYNLLHKHLPAEIVSSIKHQELIHCGLRGYYKVYNDKIERRYLMDKDGQWYEVPKGINWVSKGYPVNDDTLEAFVLDIQADYYLRGDKQ